MDFCVLLLWKVLNCQDFESVFGEIFRYFFQRTAIRLLGLTFSYFVFGSDK